MTYEPTVSPEEAARMQAWHDEHYAYLQRVSEEGEVFDYLGLTLVVPPHVQVIESTSDLLGRVVLDETRAGERVLDMGTGSGVNAILAATRGADVVAVDLNPHAVEAARANAERNGVPDRIAISQSDLFENVEGRFDLVVFDPPFRWMKPRRDSTSSPMRTAKISSAAAASSRVTWSRTRWSGSIVVSHSSSAFISPRPL